MRREGSSALNATYIPYTSTPEGRAVARHAQKHHQDWLASLPHVEMPPQLKDVGRYLTEHGHPIPSRDLSPMERHRAVEKILMDDLFQTYTEEDGAEKRNMIRRFIWAVSRKINLNDDPNLATTALLRHLQMLDTERTYDAIANAGNTEELDDRIGRLTEMKEGLHYGVTGEDLTPHAETAESEYSEALRVVNQNLTDGLKEKAEQDLTDLRLVRDEIYFRLLFPNQARMNDNQQRTPRRRSA